MIIQATHAFYNLVNCMSPYLSAYVSAVVAASYVSAVVAASF
jgi:hypothetical protein